MGRFENIAITPENRLKLNRVLEEIDKLNIAKYSYSIQELQSISVFDDRRSSQNQRILEELNDFLNAATNLGLVERQQEQERKDRQERMRRQGKTVIDVSEEYEQYMKKRNVSDDVGIDVSTLSKKIYTLVDLSFKVNKYTKWLCAEAMNLIAPEESSDRIYVNRLKEIYRNTKSEDKRRIKLDDNLNTIAEERNQENGNGIKRNKEYLKNLYGELKPIWELEEMLYEIKNQLNLQLVRCLIKDNYKEFNNWGFSKDKKENGYEHWVLNFDPTNVAERYSFHMPPKEQLSKILSTKLIRRVAEQTIIRYRNTIAKDVRKNDMNRINMQKIIQFIKNRKKTIVNRLQKTSDIDLPLYIMAKFMTRSAFEEIETEYPELKDKCEMLKELISPTHTNNLDLVQSELTETTEYQDRIRKQIEKTLSDPKKRTLYVQYRQ